MELEKAVYAYRSKKIAIYGLGPLTEKLLSQLGGYQVIGLLDGYRTSGALYGKPILSIEDAIRENVRLIIVAARPESCKVIGKRVGSLCRENAVKLLDIHGNDLGAPPKAGFNFVKASGASREELHELINTHDVISVDLFDTLIMRRTLFPTDVYELVDLRLKQRGIVIDNFPQKRLGAEKELGKETIPMIHEIYAYMLDQCMVSGILPEDLARLEWEVDRALAVPREELCELLQAVCQQGKPLYIVSDTFYTKDQLAMLLECCGITCYTDILASCDYRTGKTQALFGKLLEKVPGRTCLHIGDSLDADVEGARKNGLTACQLYSGVELFEKTGYLGLWDNIHSLSSRIQAGMLVAKLFNSPFQFEERELHVDNAYDLGYLFFGPMITGFVIWFRRQILEQGLKNIWFGARDGYLIKKLYEQIEPSSNSIYFLTSRFAAIRAGIENEADIRYVEAMRFSGSLQEQLRERFGISAESGEERHSLLDYKDEIFQAAKVNRDNYQKYIETLKMEEGDVAFFDFVARGTVQVYIQRLMDRRLKGFYFWQQDPGYMREKGLDVQTFYSPDEDAIAQNYLVLEAALMSPQPSVIGFDETGAAVFAQEKRTEQDILCVQCIQDGVNDYFRTYRDLDPAWEGLQERSLQGAMFSLISEIEIRSMDFLSLCDEDPFFNRTTGVSELL